MVVFWALVGDTSGSAYVKKGLYFLFQMVICGECWVEAYQAINQFVPGAPSVTMHAGWGPSSSYGSHCDQVPLNARPVRVNKINSPPAAVFKGLCQRHYTETDSTISMASEVETTIPV